MPISGLPDLLHQAERFAGEVHVVTEVANLVLRNGLEIAELGHFGADAVHEFAQGEHRVGLEFLVRM